MLTPVVSVVIACRNAETTLGVQLSALSRQVCPVAWNVIISDNGSTDRTVAVARSFADRLPGLVIVDSSAQAGAGYARNIGSRSTPARYSARPSKVAIVASIAPPRALSREEFVRVFARN